MNAKVKAILVAAGIFVLGLGVGALLTTLVGIHLYRQGHRFAGDASGKIEQGLENFRRDLIRQVDPTPAQLESINAELTHTGDRLRVDRRDFTRQVLRDLWSGNRRIRETLDEERRVKFDALMKERLGRFETEQAR